MRNTPGENFKTWHQFPCVAFLNSGRVFQTAADRQRYVVFGCSDLSVLSCCVVVHPACDLVGLKTFPVAQQRKRAEDKQWGLCFNVAGKRCLIQQLHLHWNSNLHYLNTKSQKTSFIIIIFCFLQTVWVNDIFPQSSTRGQCFINNICVFHSLGQARLNVVLNKLPQMHKYYLLPLCRFVGQSKSHMQ